MLSFPSNLIVTGSIKPLSSLPQVFRPVELGPGGMQAAVGMGLALWCMASGCCRHALGGLVAGGGVSVRRVCMVIFGHCALGGLRWWAVGGCLWVLSGPCWGWRGMSRIESSACARLVFRDLSYW